MSEQADGDTEKAESGEREKFPRSTSIPTQSPLFWVQQKDRYLRQLLIRDIEAVTGRRLVVYFGNSEANAFIDHTDPTYVVEILEDTKGAPVDLLLETRGGLTDVAERLASILENMAPDLRVLIAGSAKSNGTVICFAGSRILMGASSELGPIEPQIFLNGSWIPSTILKEPQISQQNLVAHKTALFAIEQTRKLATGLLSRRMMKGQPADEVAKTVEILLTRDKYFSHGSVIDHREASSLGLAIDYFPPEDDLWQKLRLLTCMYEYDCRRNNYLKVFEGAFRSSAIELTFQAPPATSQ